MRLPNGYTELEYIQSTGTQYIDTGFKPNNNTKIEVDVKLTNRNCHVFGARTSWKNNAFALFWASNTNECVQVANLNFNGGTYDEKARHKISMTATELHIDNELNASYNADTFQCEKTAWLMSCYSSSASEYAIGVIYAAKIYDNGVLVRNYIPCKNLIGDVGMYDLVNNTFSANCGDDTSEFIAGPEAIELPSGYKQLEYIQSSGTQYINTNFIPNWKSFVRMDAEFVAISGNAAPFMTRKSSGTNMFGIFNISGTLRSDYGSQKVSFPTTLSSLQRMLYSRNKNICIIASEKVENTKSNFEALYPLYLFGSNDDNHAKYLASLKIYSCQIYDAGKIVRDYIPCMSPDGVLGLYDIIGNILYKNVGSGNFIAGPEVKVKPKSSSDQCFVKISGEWKSASIGF